MMETHLSTYTHMTFCLNCCRIRCYLYKYQLNLNFKKVFVDTPLGIITGFCKRYNANKYHKAEEVGCETKRQIA